MKRVRIIVITMVIIIFILLLRGCSSKNEEIKHEKDNENNKKQEQKSTLELIKGSDIFFIGKWEMDYMDITHYTNDEKGTPNIDLYKQPSSFIFNQVGEGLILEEEYPVIEREYNEKKFSLKVDLKIIDLVIIGELVDKDNWIGTFEYIGEGGELLSKCSVKARRQR